MACGRTTRTVKVDPPPGEQGSRDNDKFAKGLGAFSGRFCLYSHGHDMSMQAFVFALSPRSMAGKLYRIEAAQAFVNAWI